MCTVQVKKRDVRGSSSAERALMWSISRSDNTKTPTLLFTGSLPLSLSFLIWKMNLRPAWATHRNATLFYLLSFAEINTVIKDSRGGGYFIQNSQVTTFEERSQSKDSSSTGIQNKKQARRNELYCSLFVPMLTTICQGIVSPTALATSKFGLGNSSAEVQSSHVTLSLCHVDS